MSTTTPVTPVTLESIDCALLASVSGGCHNHNPPPVQQTQIINNLPPAPAPQVAPPAPMVQTSVSINGQPAA
jgi:hypothetical protein